MLASLAAFPENFCAALKRRFSRIIETLLIDCRRAISSSGRSPCMAKPASGDKTLCVNVGKRAAVRASSSMGVSSGGRSDLTLIRSFLTADSQTNWASGREDQGLLPLKALVFCLISRIVLYP